MALTLNTALWFLPFVLPICLYVMWTDMKYMKITNKAVVALFVVFAVVGLFALPFDQYIWRYSNLALVLAAGFLMSAARLVGAGDAKFAAAMAPFIAMPDTLLFLMLFSAVLLVTFTAHRVAGRIPALRSATADWVSWTKKRDFPMGLALGGTLGIYLLMPVIML